MYRWDFIKHFAITLSIVVFTVACSVILFQFLGETKDVSATTESTAVTSDAVNSETVVSQDSEESQGNVGTDIISESQEETETEQDDHFVFRMIAIAGWFFALGVVFAHYSHSAV